MWRFMRALSLGEGWHGLTHPVFYEARYFRVSPVEGSDQDTNI